MWNLCTSFSIRKRNMLNLLNYKKWNKITKRFWALTLFIFSLGCVKRFGKWERTSQLRTTCVCSSVPVTILPTALSAAVFNLRNDTINIFCALKGLYFILRASSNVVFNFKTFYVHRHLNWIVITIYMGATIIDSA